MMVKFVVRSRLNIILADINADRARTQQKRLTIRQLALAAGLPTSVVSGLASHRAKRADFETLNKLCTALKCTPGDLLEYVPNSYENN